MSKLKRDAWQAVSSYLDEALAIPERERAAWLAALRDRSPGVAADVELLLEDHRVLSEEHFLEHPFGGQLERPEATGIRCGSYRLLHLIGRGGMAEVYRAVAHGLEGFQRVFVIKRILSEPQNALNAERSVMPPASSITV